MKTNVLALMIGLSVTFVTYSQSSSSLNAKVNTTLMDVATFGDSLFNVDVYFNYAPFENADSLTYQVTLEDGQNVKSDVIAFENGFQLEKVDATKKGILRIGKLSIQKYIVTIKLHGGGVLVEETNSFGY